MGTKNNPGAFDCYASAAPDEPMFILLGRDRHASGLVRLWALLRHREGEDATKVDEALKCAESMDAWLLANKGLFVSETEGVFMPLLETVTTGMDEHPEEYNYACNCNLCRSYAD